MAEINKQEKPQQKIITFPRALREMADNGHPHVCFSLTGAQAKETDEELERIHLYIPPGFQVSDGANFNSLELGMLAAAEMVTNREKGTRASQVFSGKDKQVMLLKGMEEGNIPSWAAPAVASVEQMLASRGMSASTVGRDNLINAIIQSAIPLAQANATALQTSISLDRQLIAQEEKNNAALRQQASIQNAQNVFNMDMAQFTANQQRAASNSKFLQTVSLAEASNNQQATIQNAVIAASINQQEATLTEKLVSSNAANFLKMDLTNLNARQQASMLSTQAEQQRLLSNQAATNAMAQFNAKNQNQIDQFMINLSAQIEQNNANRAAQMNQFNAAASNAAAARDAGRLVDVDKFNTQMAASIEQYNANQKFAREEFNAKNALQIEQSNAIWRREANKIDTAAQNAINARNAQNAFAMSQSAQAQLWQELRDEFDQIFKASDNTEQRKTQIAVAGLGNQHLNAGDSSATKKLKDFIELFE